MREIEREPERAETFSYEYKIVLLQSQVQWGVFVVRIRVHEDDK